MVYSHDKFLPDSESEDDDLPEDKESVVVKLERGGGGLEPYSPFPFTIFEDIPLMLPPFLLLFICFSIVLGAPAVEVFEVAPSKQIRFAEVS